MVYITTPAIPWAFFFSDPYSLFENFIHSLFSSLKSYVATNHKAVNVHKFINLPGYKAASSNNCGTVETRSARNITEQKKLLRNLSGCPFVLYNWYMAYKTIRYI